MSAASTRFRVSAAAAGIALAGLVAAVFFFDPGRSAADRGAPSAPSVDAAEVALLPAAEEPAPPPEPPAAEGRVPVRGTRPVLRVEVVDPWQRPVPNAEVVATRVDGAPEERRARISDSGSAFLSVPAGIPHRLEVLPPSPLFVREVRESVRLEAGPVRFLLGTTGFRVSGKVLAVGDEEHRPDVLLATTPNGDASKTEETWWPGGEFDLVVPAGGVLLDAWSPGWRGKSVVSGRPYEWVRGLEIALSPPPLGRIEGWVSDTAGVPVQGASVQLWISPEENRGRRGRSPLETATAEEGGRFGFEEVALGGYELRARALRHLPSEPTPIEVVDGSNEVRLVLARGGRLRFRPRTAGGLSPEGRMVLLRSGPKKAVRLVEVASGGHNVTIADEIRWIQRTAARDEEGYTVIEGLQPGTYTLQFRAEAERGETTFQVGEAETAVVDLPLSPSGK